MLFIISTMPKAEEDFPRGGAKVKKTVSKSLDEKRDSEKGPKIKRVTKPKKIERDLKPRKRKLSETSSPSTNWSGKRARKDVRPKLIDTPLHHDLVVDLCVLSCVRQTHDYSLSLSLPGNVQGTVPITEISPAYTQQLQALAHAENPDLLEDVKPAEALFKPGMLLPVVVKEITEDKQRNKKLIKLSCNPSLINGSMPLKSIEDGALLFGNISSVEDHGYRVDLGIKGLHAFLTTKDAQKFIDTHHEGAPLSIGQPIWCVLKMKDSSGFKVEESRVLHVTIDPDVVQNATVLETSKLNSLAPGMNVKAVIQRATDTGLYVNVFNFQGTIHSSQLPKGVSQYKVGEEVQVKILYINPNLKVLQLTALPKIVSYRGTAIQFFGDLKIGSIVEGKVMRTQKKKGVYFKLPGSVKGFSSASQLSDKEVENPDLTVYEKGMTVQCRVLGFNYMEGLALVTLKKSILEEKFLSVADISVGDIVQAVVKEVTFSGVVVKLSRGIFSFIPCLHLADVPIKHPEKKFEPGMKMKCRVLKVDRVKSKVMLTHKKSIVKTKYPIISDYHQIRPHMELEGYIIAVKENVVIVAFFNDVKGFVTLKDMSTEKVGDPSTMFYTGEVIRCRVVYFNAEEKKLKLSFNFGAQKPGKDQGVTMDRPSVCEIGKTMEARIERTDKDGFYLSLQPGNESAFLPFPHLSDFHEVQELRRLSFKPGQKLDKVTLFNKKRKTIVTMKESFIHAAEENVLKTTFEELKVGMLLPAVIKNHQEYGMFLELVAGHTGLCPAKTLSYLQPYNLQELFLPGQSVTTRLTRIDTEKKRFLGSVRVDECYEGGVDTSLTLLKNYLTAREDMLRLLFAENDELSMYEELNVGDIVEITVSSTLKKGILGDLTSGAKALATKNHLTGIEPKVGGKYKAVVLFIDPLTPCVELSLETKLVKAVGTRKENSKTQLKKGQILKADVLLVKPEFMLMSTRGHGTGKFVYVPVKKHINDVEFNKEYKIGSYADIVIKEPCGENQLAVLKSHDPEVLEKEREEKINFRNIMKHDMQPGMLVEAKIKVIHPLQMNIVTNKLHGRIHITEATDTPTEGENPLGRFHPEQIVQAKIIGLRDLKSSSYLPITNPRSKRTLLECTLKESKIKSQVLEGLLTPKLDLKEGDQVLAYVTKVTSNQVWAQVSLTQQGSVDIFYASKDMAVLNDISNHFVIGHGYQVTVIDNDANDKMSLSFIGGRMNLAVGEEVTAQITSMKAGSCLFVKLPAGRIGIVNTKPSVLSYLGQFIRCKVVEVEESGRFVLSLLDQSQAPHLKQRKRKRDTSVSEVESKTAEKEIVKKKIQLKKEKRRKSRENEEEEDSDADIIKDSSEPDPESQKVLTQAIREQKDAPRLTIQGFSWGGELSTDVDKTDTGEIEDEDDGMLTDGSKLKKKRKRDEEKLIQEYERSQLEGNVTPQSANDFEKLVLQSPSSSVVWLRYMAFHMELGEIEKARAVAEKALSTISFREEQEKQNVWLAYLNMETIYGDISDVKKLLDRAVAYNDPLNIYLKMCDIYVSANKTEEAEQQYIVMSRKYKRDKNVWKAYGQFLYKAGRVQAARNLLQRSVSVLDKKDHVEVITKFANLEFSHGDTERGRTMFENLIASYPGRTDLWSVYVDMVAKVGDIDGARQILDRAVKQKLNSKKLSFLVQKFIRFEETHGTEEQVQKVKDMALTLFDS